MREGPEESMIPSMIQIEENISHAGEEDDFTNDTEIHSESYKTMSIPEDVSVVQVSTWSRSKMLLLLFGLLACAISYSTVVFLPSKSMMDTNIVPIAPMGDVITVLGEEHKISRDEAVDRMPTGDNHMTTVTSTNQ